MPFDKKEIVHALRLVGTVVVFLVAAWLLVIAPLRDAAGVDPEAIARQLSGLNTNSTVSAIDASLTQVAARLEHAQLVAQARLGVGMTLLGLALLLRPLARRTAPTHQAD